MIEFNNGVWHQMGGKGIYNVQCPVDVWSNDLLRKTVVIEGKEYSIIGLDYLPAVHIYHEEKGRKFVKDEPIGLQIRGKK